MRRPDVEALTNQIMDRFQLRSVIILGSQSLHASVLKIPEIVISSDETDFYLVDDFVKTKEVNREFGSLSDFKNEHKFYADALGLASVTLPPRWQERLIPFPDSNGNPIPGVMTLEKYDTACAKMMALREKDLVCIKALIQSGDLELVKLKDRFMEIMKTASRGAVHDRLERFGRHLNSARMNGDLFIEAAVQARKAS